MIQVGVLSGPGPEVASPRMNETSDETPLSIRHPAETAAGAVVVVQEAFGVTDHIEDVCQRLADADWLAVAPHLFPTARAIRCWITRITRAFGPTWRR